MKRCVRDLAALHALPSMCVGRSPAEALAILVDALPTALDVPFVCVLLPGSSPTGSFDGTALTDDELSTMAAIPPTDAGDIVLALRGRRMRALQLEVGAGAELGRLFVGRDAPIDPETDRVLFRCSANVIATTLASARVLEAAKRKDEFLAMLGHELRNPLASISTAVELLARQSAATREQQVIERHTRHLARLVDDLLDVSRITRGHIELRREPVSLASILERAVELADPYVRRRRQTLTIDGMRDVPLDGDPVRLTQVFGNLLTNASKFTPEEGHIEVAIAREEGLVRVAVKDDGRGLAREDLGRIFEPFVQVRRDHEALSHGLGLGLAIVRTLVERHGGSIRVHSEGLGRGATFTVELPIGVDAPAAAPSAQSSAVAANRTGVRILVVDDNIDVADLLCMALNLEGFEAVAEYDARAALERWRTFRPHAGVLDVGLPSIDGYELARAVRAEHGDDPTLVAATGYGQAGDRERALEAGFDLHLVKPVSLDDLLRALDEHVRATAAG